MENWYIEIGGVIKNYFRRNMLIQPEEIDKNRSKFNNTDYYYSVYSYIGDIDKGRLTAPFYLDIDNHKFLTDETEFKQVKRDTILSILAINNIYGIPIDYIQIYFSGNKGFHIIVPIALFGIKEDNKLNEVYHLIAKDIKDHSLFGYIDLRYDRRRLFRVPNSINAGSGLYKVPLTYEELRNLTISNIRTISSKPREIEYNTNYKTINKAYDKIEDIIKMVHTPKEKRVYRYNTKFKKLLPCTLNVLENGAENGNRNNVTVAIASALLQNGIEFEEVLDRVIKWNEEKNSPSLGEREVKKAVLSARKELEKGFRFGCTKMIEYGYCIPEKCKKVQ